MTPTNSDEMCSLCGHTWHGLRCESCRLLFRTYRTSWREPQPDKPLD